ncbi:MAG: hypothetical protein IIA17_01770 [candidate division Zixibacteria bacterium]|nr:hypothetical protein [candidate division Zixibacteria bacterium]
MKRLYLYYCILIFGFFYGGSKAAYAGPSLILSNSADIQVNATVINPVGFVSRKFKEQGQLTGRAIEFSSSREISVLTSRNTLLEIDNGHRKFFLISSENFGFVTIDDNLLRSKITPLISFISMISAELSSKTITDSSLCLIRLITISD